MEAYLCLRGPFLPLLFVTAVVSAIWNELSVYKLPRTKSKIFFDKSQNNMGEGKKKKKNFTSAKKMKHTSVISIVMGSENSVIISVSVEKHL